MTQQRSQKDMRVVRRTVPFARAFKDKITAAPLKNYTANGLPVALRWDLNKAANRDKMFELRIGDNVAILDLEELLSYTRLF